MVAAGDHVHVLAAPSHHLMATSNTEGSKVRHPQKEPYEAACKEETIVTGRYQEVIEEVDYFTGDAHSLIRMTWTARGRWLLEGERNAAVEWCDIDLMSFLSLLNHESVRHGYIFFTGVQECLQHF